MSDIAPAPRRITWPRLFQMVRRLPQFREPQLLQEVVPYGAERVLKTVCQAVADSAELGLYRPIPALAGRSVAAALGARMGILGAEGQIAEDLGALIGAGMVLELADGTLTLPLDFAALQAGMPAGSGQARTAAASSRPGEVSAAPVRDVGGRPRRGEDARQRRLRLLSSMPAGGAVRAGETSAAREVSGEVSAPETSPRGNLETSQNTEVSGAGNLPGNPGSGFGGGAPRAGLAAAALFQEDIDSVGLIGEQQQEEDTAETSRAGGETGVSRFPLGEVSGEVSRFPEGEVSEVSRFPAASAAETSAAPAAGSASPINAPLLALEVGTILGVSGRKGTPSTDAVTKWLGFGLTADRIRAVARDRKDAHDRRMASGDEDKPIGSFDYLDDPMREAAGLPPKLVVAATGDPSEAPLPELPPRFHGQGFADSVVHAVRCAVCFAQRGDQDLLPKSLERLGRLSGSALRLFYKEYPQLRPDQQQAPRTASA